MTSPFTDSQLQEMAFQSDPTGAIAAELLQARRDAKQLRKKLAKAYADIIDNILDECDAEPWLMDELKDAFQDLISVLNRNAALAEGK